MNSREAAQFAVWLACREWCRGKDVTAKAATILERLTSVEPQAKVRAALLLAREPRKMLLTSKLTAEWREVDGVRLKGYVRGSATPKPRIRCKVSPGVPRCSWCGKKGSFPLVEVTDLRGSKLLIHETCFKKGEHFR